MILGVDPKVDYAFKHMLGRESTRPILINVIDSVLNPPPGHATRDIDLLNPFNPKEAFNDKLSILDIKARDQAGRQFNIEMQMLWVRGYEKRIVYYGAKFHQQQLHEGDDYGKLRPTISISFLNHVLFPQVPDYHLRFRLLEQTHYFPFTNDIEFHVLELPKFTKTVDELTSDLDIWLYFLRHAEKMDSEAPPPSLRKPLVLSALKELKMLTQSELERERYESRLKAQRDYNFGLNEARREALQEGRQEGEQIGTIQLCERLLRLSVTPLELLTALSLDELTRRAAELQKQLFEQQGTANAGG